MCGKIVHWSTNQGVESQLVHSYRNRIYYTILQVVHYRSSSITVCDSFYRCGGFFFTFCMPLMCHLVAALRVPVLCIYFLYTCNSVTIRTVLVGTFGNYLNRVIVCQFLASYFPTIYCIGLLDLIQFAILLDWKQRGGGLDTS